jgi:hypothetical protein
MNILTTIRDCDPFSWAPVVKPPVAVFGCLIEKVLKSSVAPRDHSPGRASGGR